MSFRRRRHSMEVTVVICEHGARIQGEECLKRQSEISTKKRGRLVSLHIRSRTCQVRYIAQLTLPKWRTRWERSSQPALQVAVPNPPCPWHASDRIGREAECMIGDFHGSQLPSLGRLLLRHLCS